MMPARLPLLSPVTSRSHPRGKPTTRRTLLSRRDALSVDEHARASQSASEAVARILASRVAPGSTVGLYVAKGSELDPRQLDDRARALGFVVAYPRVVDGSRLLAFHVAAHGDLVPARFGLREPRATAPQLDVATIAAFVIPGLAFDRGGGRIGWGFGHYDATLAAAPHALAIGVAFETQLVERVPREPHDRLVDVLVTELTTYWIGA
jgi:5-formyltetrahydrofolate cyclo-ligase